MTESGFHPARLAVGIVGCGRVGAAMGAALVAAGHEVVAVSAVSDASVRRAEELLPGVPIRPVDEVVALSHLVLLTVPDDALATLVHGLAATGAFRPGQILVHTSGRHGLAVLEPASPICVPLALHPAMTFAGSATDVQRLRECTIAVTCGPAARPLAELIAMELGSDPVWLPDQVRPLYHAALAHGANHLVTLVAQSLELLAQAGVEDPSRMLRPLVEAALDNVLTSGESALTGPVARGDAGTVRAHLQVLAEAPEDVRVAYRAMARATAWRSERGRRLSPGRAQLIRDVLDDKET